MSTEWKKIFKDKVSTKTLHGILNKVELLWQREGGLYKTQYDSTAQTITTGQRTPRLVSR